VIVEYSIGLLIWVALIWLIWTVTLTIKQHKFIISGTINVFLTALLVHAIAWLAGFSLAGLLPYNFDDGSMLGHEEMVELAILFFVDKILSWILLFVSLFLIALRINR